MKAKPMIAFEVIGNAENTEALKPWFVQRFHATARDAANREFGLLQASACKDPAYAGMSLCKQINQLTMNEAGDVLESKTLNKVVLKNEVAPKPLATEKPEKPGKK